MRSKTSILLYGDIDLNLIDGSAIWLAALAEVLSNEETFQVAVLLKTPLHDQTVVAGLIERESVCFLDPWNIAKERVEWAHLVNPLRGPFRLKPEIAVRLIELADREKQYDLILVRADARGCAMPLDLCRQTTVPTRRKGWLYITNTAHLSADDLMELGRSYRRLMCQTPQARRDILTKLGGRIPEVSERILILPPMIPACPGRPEQSVLTGPTRLCYSGKFSREYYAQEMLDAFEDIQRRSAPFEFHVIGDKFTRYPDDPDFGETLRRRFMGTAGVVWHGRKTREETQRIVRDCHIAVSWRDPIYDESLELSTKVLEYSAMGLPVLMNRATVQKELFGETYPLYVGSRDEFVSKAILLKSNRDFYDQVSGHVISVAAPFTYDKVLEQLRPAIIEDTNCKVPSPGLQGVSRRQRLLFAGHDMRFVMPLIQYFTDHPEYEVRVDHWMGHEKGDASQSEAMLPWADVIFCEWCMGNARWYSQHKRPDQRLFVRLHSQEMRLHFRYELEWPNVDAIIFINHNHYETFCDEQSEHAAKSLVIYNPIDCHAFDQPNFPGAEFNLGLVGVNPMIKRPDLAVEILARLWEQDPRYTLFIKSRMPWEYGWLWRRPDERDYYIRFFESLETSPHRNSVVFDEHGDDMPAWYSKIGFILSTSDREGSHQAVAEGMAAGCVPIVRDWFGATPLYPKRFIFSTVDQAVELVRQYHASDLYDRTVMDNRAYAHRYFDTPVIAGQYALLFGGAGIRELFTPHHCGLGLGAGPVSAVSGVM